MEGFDKFQHAILETAKTYILPLMETEKKAAFGEAMKNHLLDLTGPTEVKSKHTEREIYFFKLFYGFTEIAGSLETLEDISIFVGRFPFRGTRVLEERYLQFQVECYLAEVYLLRERLKSYLTLVKRQYKRDPRLVKLTAVVDHLENIIYKSLNGIIRTRDSHVHQVRFTDKDFDRLRGIGLLARNGSDNFAQAMQTFYKYEHSRIRRKWKKQIIDNNKATKELLDVVFGALYAVLVDEKANAVLYPTRLMV